jgi:t-SNARE complex subunit (syntaxin)
VLDRIDYNIESTLVKVQEGTQELVKADKQSAKSRSLKCILFLLLIIAVFVIILVFKNKDK